MTHHHYAMLSRPCDIGCQPVGFVRYEPAEKGQTGHHGVLTYERELTEEEVKRFELRKL